MELPCTVVRDLLPLFAEKMIQPETQSLIEEHLSACPECRKEYSEITAGATATEDTVISTLAPLRTLKKELRRRRWYAALIAGLFVFVIAIIYVYHSESLKPLPWEEGLVTVEGIEEINPDDCSARHYQNIVRSETVSSKEHTENALILKINSPITGTETEYIEENGTVTVILQGFGRSSSPAQNVSSQNGELIFRPIPDRLIYGYQNPQMLLWGEPMNGGIEVLPRLTLNYYMMIAAALAALSGILWLVWHRKKWIWVVRQIFFAPLSYILAHLFVMGFRSISFSITRDFCFILLTAAALYGLISLLWQVWLKRKKTA